MGKAPHKQIRFHTIKGVNGGWSLPLACCRMGSHSTLLAILNIAPQLAEKTLMTNEMLS